MPKIISEKFDLQIKNLYTGGSTGTEIAFRLNTTLKKVYTSLRRQKIPRKNMWEQNRLLFERKAPSFSFKEKLTHNERELMVAGIMLYLGEGAKNGNTVDLANSDVRVAKLFIKFLRKICGVDEEKIRCYLFCFSDQNQNDLIAFWSSQLNVETRLFTKPYVRSTLNRGNRSMPYGVIHVRYNDKKLLSKILSLCTDLIGSL